MTRKIVSTLSVAALLSAGALAQAADTNAAPAASATTNSIVAAPTKVAIINIQAAIANTHEGQRDLDALQKKFETKQKTLQRDLEDAQNDYQTQSNEIAQRIGTKLMQSLDAYAKQNGYAVVIDVSQQQSPVLWAAQSVDITKPVIDAYNAASGVPAPTPTAKTTPSAPSAVTHRPATSSPAAPRPASGTTPK